MRRTVTFDRRPTMSCALMLAVMFLTVATTPSASASAIESSTLILESLTITPASGSITFSSSNVVADAFVNSIVFGSESDSDLRASLARPRTRQLLRLMLLRRSIPFRTPAFLSQTSQFRITKGLLMRTQPQTYLKISQLLEQADQCRCSQVRYSPTPSS